MIKPATNRLLVRVEKEPEPKEGEMAQKKGNTVFFAEVVRVGPDVKMFKGGDVVVFPPFGFDEVEVAATPGSDEKEKLVLISEEMIIGSM